MDRRGGIIAYAKIVYYAMIVGSGCKLGCARILGVGVLGIRDDQAEKLGAGSTDIKTAEQGTRRVNGETALRRWEKDQTVPEGSSPQLYATIARCYIQDRG